MRLLLLLWDNARATYAYEGNTSSNRNSPHVMLISMYENPKCSHIRLDTQIKLAHCCGPVEANQTTAAATKVGPFLSCSLLPPPMHTHAYTHTCLPWQMACDVPLWTWHERVHSLSPGLTERQPRPVDGTPECLCSAGYDCQWISSASCEGRENLERKHNGTGWDRLGAE